MNFAARVAGASPEPTLQCPHCRNEIKLTESLAAPLLEETCRRFQEQLASKDAEVTRKVEALREEREQLTKAREQIEDQVAKRLSSERTVLVAAEAKKAREAAAAELQAKEAEASELRQSLASNNAKLAEAQQAQAELIRKQRALDEEKRELDLTIEKRVQASIADIQAKARLDADEAARLRVLEKDQTIESMTRTIEELKRKAEQGSQQSQGEALELELEVLCRVDYPVTIMCDMLGVSPVGYYAWRTSLPVIWSRSAAAGKDGCISMRAIRAALQFAANCALSSQWTRRQRGLCLARHDLRI